MSVGQKRPYIFVDENDEVSEITDNRKILKEALQLEKRLNACQRFLNTHPVRGDWDDFDLMGIQHEKFEGVDLTSSDTNHFFLMSLWVKQEVRVDGSIGESGITTDHLIFRFVALRSNDNYYGIFRLIGPTQRPLVMFPTNALERFLNVTPATMEEVYVTPAHVCKGALAEMPFPERAGDNFVAFSFRSENKYVKFNFGLPSFGTTPIFTDDREFRISTNVIDKVFYVVKDEEVGRGLVHRNIVQHYGLGSGGSIFEIAVDDETEMIHFMADSESEALTKSEDGEGEDSDE